MKAHIGGDVASGQVHTVTGTAAHVADIAQTHELLHGEEKAVYADAGYVGAEKRVEVLAQARQAEWHVAHGNHTTKNSLRRIIETTSKWARQQGYLDQERKTAAERAITFRGVEGAPAIFTPDELEKILAVCPANFLPHVRPPEFQIQYSTFHPMPFDPAKPAAGDDLDAVLIRNQLNELKALIDAQANQIANLQGQINAAVAGTSNNSNGVGNLSISISNNPPQQFEVQPIADKVDELINALRRP